MGRGGMGVVYRARHTRLGTECAVKVLLDGAFASEAAVERFEQEARAVAKMGKQPNIVEVYDLGCEGGHHYYAMELVEGCAIDVYCQAYLLDDKSCAALVEKVARALHLAHSHGILHRDVTPHNILVRRDGEPQVTDFGLARDVRAATRLSSADHVMGTPSYMAPEQASGRPTDARTDVYGIGAILYQLLAWRPPHEKGTLDALLASVRDDDVVSPRRYFSSIPRDLETVCLKCMERDPERRYQTAEALADDLERFRMGDPVRARRVSPLEKAWRWCRRHPGLLAASALVLAVAIVAMVTVRGAGVRAHWSEAFRLAMAEGKRQEDLGKFQDALDLYDQAWDRVDKGDLPALQEQMVRCVRKIPTLPFSTEQARGWRVLLQHGADRSFGAEADAACVRALSQELEQGGGGMRSALYNPQKLDQIELRERVACSDKDLSPEDRKQMEEAQEFAETIRKDLPAGTPVEETRLKSPKEEEMEARLAADQSPIARARASFDLGRLAEDEKRAKDAAEWYGKASQAARSVFPFTSTAQGILNQDDCDLVREIEEGLQRVDPSAPDRLKGRLTFVMDGAEVGPRGYRPRLWIALRDPKVGREESKAIVQLFDENVTLTLGVAEGRYALCTREELPKTEPGGAEEACSFGLALGELPKEIEVKGEVTLHVRLRRLPPIDLVPPAGGASLTEKVGRLRWRTAADGVVSYHVWLEACNAKTGDLQWSIEGDASEPKAWLSEVVTPPGIPGSENNVSELQQRLDAGGVLRWRVEAVDAEDHYIASSGAWASLLLAPSPKGK